MGTANASPSNALGDPAQSLQTFNLLDLQQYTQEKAYSTTASKDFHLFYVGRDDVHDILKHVLPRASISLYLNMFGFDDDELNDILMAKVADPQVIMLITLDKSQAGGVMRKGCFSPMLLRTRSRSTRISLLANLLPIRSVTPKASWLTAGSAAKARRTGRPRARAPSSLPEGLAAQATKPRTIRRQFSRTRTP